MEQQSTNCVTSAFTTIDWSNLNILFIDFQSLMSFDMILPFSCYPPLPQGSTTEVGGSYGIWTQIAPLQDCLAPSSDEPNTFSSPYD